MGLYADYQYKLAVIDDRTKAAITSGVSVYIYTAGSKTLATTYGNASRASRVNPTTFTAFDGEIDFYVAATTVDIFLADDKGNTGFFPSISPTDHTLKLNRDGLDKCFMFPFAFSTTSTEQDTGLDFPLNTWIYDAMVEVVTTDSGETFNIGLLSTETNGNATGILVGVPIESAGFVKPWSVTDSSTEDYVSSPYWGALMGKGSAGTSAANDHGQHGGVGHVVSGSNAVSLSYIPSSSDTMAGYGYVFFRHLR